MSVQDELCGKGLSLTDPRRGCWSPSGSAITQGEQHQDNHASNVPHQGNPLSSIRNIKLGYGCSKATMWKKKVIKRIYLGGVESDKEGRTRQRKGGNREYKE